MSRFMRGQDWRQDSQSNMEFALLIRFQNAKLKGEIKEVPLTPPWTDILLSLDRVDPIVCHPDFRFVQSAFWSPIFIDGAIHTHHIIALRDAEVNGLLAKQGFHPMRYRYGKDTKSEENRIYGEILGDLKLSRKEAQA